MNKTFRHFRILVLFGLIFFMLSGAAYAEIEWKIFIRQYINSGPILSKTTSPGEILTINGSDFLQIPSESEDIIYALEGVSFLLQQSPVIGKLSIHIILNTNGNTFTKVSGIPLFLNMELETYVDGSRDDTVTFSRSPLIVTIPQSSLSYLLSSCGLSRDGIICAYSNGGAFTNEGIATSNMTTRLEITIEEPSHTVGGSAKDLGVEASVKQDSWYKIKLLFK